MLRRFWHRLSHKNISGCRMISVYMCGILLYRIGIMPDNNRSQHYLFGIIPFLMIGRKVKTKFAK